MGPTRVSFTGLAGDLDGVGEEETGLSPRSLYNLREGSHMTTLGLQDLILKQTIVLPSWSGGGEAILPGEASQVCRSLGPG